jgi:hypothetical protein
MRDQRATHDDAAPAGRRGFMEALACWIAAGVGLVLGRKRTPSPTRSRPRAPGPRELELSEADLFGPHDLAG